MPPVARLEDHFAAATFSVGSVGDYEKGLVGFPESRARVTFDDDSLVVHEIECIVGDEQKDVWYSREEFDIIKARNSLIVRMMKGGQFQESPDHTFRGLEHKIKERHQERRQNKFNALNAVLEEQDRQFRRRLNFPELIKDRYIEATQRARQSALAVGHWDAVAVKGKIPKKSTRKTLCETLEPTLRVEDEDDCTLASDASRLKRIAGIRRIFGANRRRTSV